MDPIGCATISNFVHGIKHFYKKNKSLQNLKIVDFEATIADLQDLPATVMDLTDRVVALEAVDNPVVAIGALQNDVMTLQDDVTAVQTSVTTNCQKIKEVTDVDGADNDAVVAALLAVQSNQCA